MRELQPMRSFDQRTRYSLTRWRVALLGRPDPSSTTLPAAVIQAGGRVVLEAPLRTASLKLIRRAAPEVLIVCPETERYADLVPFMSSGRPVVLFTHDTSRPLLKLAARSGVAGFLVAPLQASQLAPTLDLAVARFEECAALRRKLADRTAVERAKGQLMASHGLTEDDAFRWLRTRAMTTRSTLGDVARDVTENGVAMTLSSAEDSAVYSQVPMV
jgi:two-component system, response regulator / RNA-binding antiterminator